MHFIYFINLRSSDMNTQLYLLAHPTDGSTINGFLSTTYKKTFRQMAAPKNTLRVRFVRKLFDRWQHYKIFKEYYL